MARRIRYRHPHWPGRALTGLVVSTGKDGHLVKDEDTGQEREVRHEDVLLHLPEADELDSGTADGYGRLQKAAVVVAPAGPLLPPPPPAIVIKPNYATMPLGDLRALAAPYADQYEAGHPADFRHQQTTLLWSYDPHFPLAKLPGTKDDWAMFDWNHGRHLGFAVRQEPPIIVVRGRDEHYYVLDGNHRVAESYAAGLEHAPAIVGRCADRHQDAYLPPGFYGRSGVRKSLGLGGAPLLLLKSTVRLGQPAKMWSARERVHRRVGQQAGKGTGVGVTALEAAEPVAARAPQWRFPARVSHRVGHFVQYQRPDMPGPEIGRVESLGRQGGWVSNHQGQWKKVRHEHIHGSAFAHVRPEERGEAAEALMRAGVPVDAVEAMLTGHGEDGPNMQLAARVKALIDDGAPIRKEGLAGRSAQDVRRLVERFTGPLPREADLPEEPKKHKPQGPKPVHIPRRDEEA